MKIKKSSAALRPHSGYRNLDYARSRRATFYEIISAQFVVVTITGPILAGYLAHIGIDANVAAVLMQLSMLGAVAQGISPLFFMHRKNRIKWVTRFFALYRILNLGMLVPIFLSGRESRIWVFALFSFFGYFAGYFAEPAWLEFLTGVVPLRMRGRFFGRWDASYIAAGAAYSLAASFLLDRFRGAGMERNGFFVLFAILAVASVVEISTFFLMKEPPVRLTREEIAPRAYLLMPFRDKSFRSSLKAVLLYNIAQNVAIAFISIYPITVLRLNYTFVAVAVALGTAARVLAGPLWGALADRRGWCLVLRCSTGMLGISMVVFFLLNRANAPLLLPLGHILNGAGLGGATIGFMNLSMTTAHPEHKALYLGVYGSVGTFTGFGASLCGAGLGALLSKASFQVGGVPIESMQLLFLLSALLFGLVVWSLKRFFVHSIPVD